MKFRLHGRAHTRTGIAHRRKCNWSDDQHETICLDRAKIKLRKQLLNRCGSMRALKAHARDELQLVGTRKATAASEGQNDRKPSYSSIAICACRETCRTLADGARPINAAPKFRTGDRRTGRRRRTYMDRFGRDCSNASKSNSEQYNDHSHPKSADVNHQLLPANENSRT